MDEKIAVKAIEDKLETLKKVQSHEQFDTWQNSTILTLINIYSDKDRRVKTFEEIESYRFLSVSGIDRTLKAILEAEELLKNLIKDIRDFGITKKDEKSKTNSVNVHVNQHNNQSQSAIISIDLNIILNIFKGELRSSELEELKEILDSEIEIKEKKKNFIDKIKSFGSDVSSNILASLITNPQVYEQLGNIL